MPYTSVNGHMFSFLTKEKTLALRLPAEALEQFLRKYKTKLCEQHGTILKEYAEVPASLLTKTAELKRHFKVSYDYVSALKSKPTKRAKKSVAKKSAKNPKKKTRTR